MKSLLKKIGIALLSVSLISPMVEAQNRTSGNRGNGHSQQQHQQAARPSATRPSGNSGNNGRPNNNGNQNRPGNNTRPNNNGGQNRPNNNGNNNRPNNNNRPGNNGNHNNGNQYRPGNNDWHFGGNHGNPGNVNPGHVNPGHVNPGHPTPRPPMVAPPMRPHRPVASHWSRPVPPPTWRPVPSAPSISAILGIAFGSAFNVSLNYLYNSGYSVDGYGDNMVYLRDVNQFNYFWPDATLYYNNGGLARSEFLYSSPYPDTVRYNSLYRNFMGIYGAPVNYSTNGLSASATWFAPNQGYITLQYGQRSSLGGGLRFFTTVTYGL